MCICVYVYTETYILISLEVCSSGLKVTQIFDHKQDESEFKIA